MLSSSAFSRVNGDGMTPEEVLTQLRDIHGASPPSWWPPAPGYYMILFALLVFAVCGIVGLRMRSRLRLRKAILFELKAIEDDFYHHNNVGSLQASLSALFRRIAHLKARGDMRFLDLDEAAHILLGMMPNQEETRSIIDLLKTDRYHKAPQVDGTLLISLSREQIKRCRI